MERRRRHPVERGVGGGRSRGLGWSIPAPRDPVADTLGRLSPRSGAASAGDVDRLVAELVEVAVWTSRDGDFQEHATLLLASGERRWHAVGFSEPAATVLIPKLRGLPGFDADLLLELLRGHSQHVVTLWRRDSRSRS